MPTSHSRATVVPEPKARHRWPLIPLSLAALLSNASDDPAQSAADDTWPHYGHDAGGMRYSPLSQINRDNVSRLTRAWVFHTGDISDGSRGRQRSGFETTPIVVDGTLYLTTPFNRVIALDPETGLQRWAYDPMIDQTLDYGDGLVNRGVATWLDGARASSQPCRRRIFEATQDARLIALDATTGKLCLDFGESGQVNLRDVPGYRAGWYHMTSPPIVIADLVVVGSAINDNQRVVMPAGVVRAFDARSGALRWTWDPIPKAQAGKMADGKDGGSRAGGANAWSIMSVDPERNLIFIPTGSASPDYYGGDYSPQSEAPYGLFRRFLQSPSGLPCTAPPWGQLTAVDMTEGKIRWQVPLGSMQDFGGKHPPVPAGSINLGGPIVTAGGIAFIAGTFDPFIRAFDVDTGKELWKAPLPNSGHATPMTYRLSPQGKQYVVIAAGGHPKITEESLGDALVAFTLP